MLSPEIIYEDNHLIVINKPAGMLTQGDSTSDLSLLDWTKKYLKDKYNKPGDVFLGLLHRLDRPVSGVICFARTGKAASRISEQFRSKKTQKIYHAIVEGIPARRNAHLKNWLISTKGAKSSSSKITINKRNGAKQAELKYSILKSSKNQSMLEIELLTGLKHQIRAQLAFIGTPISGDFRYSPKNFAPQKINNGHAILLHARKLSLIHPTKKEELTFTAPYPNYFPDFNI